MATSYNDIEQSDKIYEAMLRQREELDKKSIEKFLVDREKALRAASKTEKDIYDDLLVYRNKMEREAAENRQEDENKLRQASLIALDKYETTLLKSSTRRERAEIHTTRIERQKAFQKEYTNRQKNELLLRSQAQALEEAIASEKDKTIKNRLKKQLKSIEELYNKERQWISENADLYGKSGEKIIDESLAKAQEIINSADASKEEIAEEKSAIESILKTTGKGDPKRAQAEKTRSDLAMKELTAQAEDRKQAAKDRNQQKKDEMKWLLKTEEGRTQLLKNATASMVNGLSKVFDSYDQHINTFYEYQAKYQARLEGSGNDYEKMMSSINKQLGLSPFVKQSVMVKNLQELVDKGINYNVELRAYLATLSDNIASTFDAFDSNLLRLIRIQQSDSTAARLGIEASLNKFLNSMFSDTSYLGQGSGSGIADTVSSYLLDASAQLSHQAAAEMEFVAQKWLGSLYSLGVGDDAIQSIAQGLGYLGSGNIETLSSNDTLMSLLSMSASRGGTSISEILTGGLNATKTDKLLRGMVEYLAEIANNTDTNNVTRASMAQVFGLTNTDLKSISNLTKQDIDNIALTSLNYGGALVETANQLNEISSRMHISQMISNVIENATTGGALQLGSNPLSYGLYKALNVVSGLVGDRGMEIPGIQALGTGTASGIDVLSIAKAAISGGTLLSQLITSISNMGNGGLPQLSSFEGYEKSLQRGSPLELQPEGVQSGYSESHNYSRRYGSGSISDISASSMQSANETAKENQSSEDQSTADKAEVFYEDGLIQLNKTVNLMEDLTAESAAKKMHVLVDTPTDKPLPVKLMMPGNENGDKLKVHLEGVSEDIATRLNNSLKAIILSAFIDETIQPTTGAATTPLAIQIKEALQGLSVNINNDFFDEYIQKNALGGI